MADTKIPKTKQSELEYDSNPFTISFRGFGLFAQYAKGVIVAIVIFAVISFGFNMLGQILPAILSSGDSSSSQPENDYTFSDNVDSYSSDAALGDEEVSIDSFIQDIRDDSRDDSTSSENNSSELNATAVASIVALVVGVILVIVLITAPITILISAVIKGIIAAGMMSSVANKEISFGEAFSQMGSRLGTLFVAELISGLKIIGGYLLLIVPGVRAQLRYESVPYIIMSNSDISAGDALRQAKDLYNKHLMEVFGIKFVGGIIPVIGSAITAGGMGLSLQQLQLYKANNLETPKTHWLNYVGLILAALLMLFFVGIVGIIVLIAANN